MTDSGTPIKPPPAWSAAFPSAASPLTIATYSAQARDLAKTLSFLRWWDEACDQDSGPEVSERARFTDIAGYGNEVRVAYWRDPGRFADWSSSSIVTDW